MGDTMEQEKKKRYRSANFSSREASTLFAIISKYKNIVENKKTDAVSVEEKFSAWTKIITEFNCSSPDFVSRSTESLKKYYDNKKKDVRKRKAEEKMEILLTGGGPPPRPMDGPEDIVLSLMDPLTVIGGTNDMDSDSIPITPSCSKQDQDNEIVYVYNSDLNDLVEEQELEEIDNDEASRLGEKNWKRYTPMDLKRPKSDPLNRVLGLSENSTCASNNNNPMTMEKTLLKTPVTNNKKKLIDTSRRRPTSTVVRALSSSSIQEKYSDLADKKDVIAEYKLRKIKMETEFSKEKHALECENLKLDILLKKKKLEKLDQC